MAVVTASLCILSRSAMSAVLWLTVTMLSLAAIYVLLSAEFVAAIQVLVYAGAVMVLFLFVVMLLNLGHPTTDMRGPAGGGHDDRHRGAARHPALRPVALHARTGSRAEVAQSPAVQRSRHPLRRRPGSRAQEAVARGVVGAVAAPLFQVYLVPFEITSILLLAAIVGAVVLAKRRI